MCPDAAPEWTVSADELNRLAELFRQFEGAADPLSVPCREAESEFNSLVERIYHEKVEPAFTSITLSIYASRRTGPASVLQGVKSQPVKTQPAQKPATPPPAQK